MLRIACVLYQNNQVRRMNTKYSNKTSLFWVYLKYGEQKARKYYEMRRTISKYCRNSEQNKERYKHHNFSRKPRRCEADGAAACSG